MQGATARGTRTTAETAKEKRKLQHRIEENWGEKTDFGKEKLKNISLWLYGSPRVAGLPKQLRRKIYSCETRWSKCRGSTARKSKEAGGDPSRLEKMLLRGTVLVDENS